MPTLHQHRLRTHAEQFLAHGAQIIGGCDGHAGEGFGLRDIGRQDGCTRQKQFRHRSLRFGLQQSRAAFGPHDRINHHRRVTTSQSLHDSLDHGRAVQHAGLDGIGAQVAEHHLNLLGDEFVRHAVDVMHPLRVLRRQRGQRRHGKAAQRRYGFDVSLNACAAARIRASDD